MNDLIEIYTDGACSGNPGKGGWGAVLLYKEHKKEISGFQMEATNNQMELMAVIEALKIVKKSFVETFGNFFFYIFDLFVHFLSSLF